MASTMNAFKLLVEDGELSAPSHKKRSKKKKPKSQVDQVVSGELRLVPPFCETWLSVCLS